MEAHEDKEHVLSLLDFYWFHHHILRRPPPPVPPPPSQQLHVLYQPHCGHLHSCSLGEDGCLVAALRTHSPPKLETILSSQIQVTKEEMKIARADVVIRRKKKKRGISKSMSDLEFEELKGFMDLGFTFSGGAEADPRLVLIVPGLKRAARGKETVAAEEGVDVVHPYLSEAWEEEEEKEKNPLRNWTVPVRLPGGGERVDLKGHLKVWAHAVASAAR